MADSWRNRLGKGRGWLATKLGSMKSSLRFVALLVLAIGVLGLSRSGWCWGRRGHELVNERAIENLPEPLRAFFRSHAEYLVGRASDPDLLSQDDPAEKPHHYTDGDAYDRNPFPLIEEHFVREHRGPTAGEKRNGDVLWQIETYTLRLSKDFEFKRWNDADHDAVFVAHYAADLTQPLHTVSNYDGQLTRQAGIHARFETELVNAMIGNLKLTPRPAEDVPNLRARIFAEYLASYLRSADVFDADRRAVAGRSYLDPGYFPAFLMGAGPIAEERLSAAISLVSSLWYTAWVRAGRPRLPEVARSPAMSRQKK